MPFEFQTTPLDGLLVIQPRVFPDGRGFFKETFKASDFAAHGIATHFKQDNCSFSSQGILRGLHFQRGEHAQGKLVQVYAGAVWDVAVDLRPRSPSFGRWFGIELSAMNHRLFWIPPGFAHGFVTLTEDVVFSYKCTEEYHPASEGGVIWNDPELAIQWPVTTVQVSEKDQRLPPLGAVAL